MFVFLFVTFFEVLQSSSVPVQSSARRVVLPSVYEEGDSQEKYHKGRVDREGRLDQSPDLVFKYLDQQCVVVITAVYEHN